MADPVSTDGVALSGGHATPTTEDHFRLTMEGIQDSAIFLLDESAPLSRGIRVPSEFMATSTLKSWGNIRPFFIPSKREFAFRLRSNFRPPGPGSIR